MAYPPKHIKGETMVAVGDGKNDNQINKKGENAIGEYHLCRISFLSEKLCRYLVLFRLFTLPILSLSYQRICTPFRASDGAEKGMILSIFSKPTYWTADCNTSPHLLQ